MRQVSEVMREGEYLPVANLSPDIADALTELRGEAQGLIEDRRHLVESGRSDEVPLAIDALSTGDSAIRARDEHGIDSAVFAERRQALVLDCVRLLKEWKRKLKPEYFGKLKHHYSQPEEEFYSHGLAVGQMTLNALRPIPKSSEEETRRINERVEDRNPVIIQKVGGFVLGAVGIRTISECTYTAIEEFEADQAAGRPHSGYDGYVPEVEKLMIRDVRIDPETGDRTQEQVGLVGKYSITHDVVQEALRRRGVNADDLDKTALHGLQLLVNDDLKDFVKLLDQVASEEWCVPIFMGERVSEDHPMDYDAFWIEAERREEDLADLAEITTSFIIDLADDPSFDRHHAAAHVEQFVKRLLLQEATQDITVAQHAFGEETKESIARYNNLVNQGLNEEAFALMQQIEKTAPGGGYCSGGSCGLEGVNLNSAEGMQLKEKLKAEAGDIIVKDKERACKCGKKEIVYAYSAGKVNKYCTSCKAFESKKTVGKK